MLFVHGHKRHCTKGGVLASAGLTVETKAERQDTVPLLPCNMVVRQDTDGKTVVGLMDPTAVVQLVDKPAAHELATKVKERLGRVRDALA